MADLVSLIAGKGSSRSKSRQALTVRELSQKSGQKRERIIEVLRALLEAGKLEVVRVQTRSLSGANVSVPAYRVKIEKSRAKSRRKK